MKPAKLFLPCFVNKPKEFILTSNFEDRSLFLNVFITSYYATYYGINRSGFV